MSSKYKLLYDKLGYAFKQSELLTQALTHRSVSGKNYERLEFLGDALLSVIIAEWLFHHMPTADEGSLSRFRSALVCGDTLSEIAHEVTLGEYLYLGPGELKTGGERRVSILSDSLEAVIGAIYLDADLETCRKVVLQLFKEKLEIRDLEKSTKDAKSSLQEYLQAKRMALPEYDIVRIEGQEHQQTFHVVCRVAQIPYEASGEGSTRRRAEQQAAENLMNYLNIYDNV